MALLEALLEHELPTCSLRTVRRLSQLSHSWRKALDTEQSWRIACAALAAERGLYAPAACSSWRSFFFDTLWPARHKWSEASERIGFRIRVAVRVRPRKRDARGGELLLPLHQRLRMLKKGQKLTFEDASMSSDEVMQAVSQQQDQLPPDLLQALLEAQQLSAASKHAAAQAMGSNGHSARDMSIEDGSAAAAAAAAVAAAASEPTALSSADREALSQAVNGSADGDGASGAGQRKALQSISARDDDEAASRRNGVAKLLLVQPSRVVMFVPGVGVRPFAFPVVCGESAPQVEVYLRAAQDAVCSALNGLNACILAYGQTGSGKTHTVFGPADSLAAAEKMGAAPQQRAESSLDGLGVPSRLPPNAGIVLRACEELLECAAAPAHACDAITLSAQYVQLYEESLIDLFSGAPVTLREAPASAFGTNEAPFVLQGAAHIQLHTLADVVALLRAGEAHKRVAATAMNEASSRAHTLFLLTLTQRGRVIDPSAGFAKGGRHVRAAASSGSTGGGDGSATPASDALLVSHLSVVDLAGCEQVKQSGVAGLRLKEAVGINSSLLVLGKVISALSEGRAHVPYFETKLTRLLRSSFGGSSRTTCIVTASPDDEHAENTVQALRFGERCATIVNSATVSSVSSSEALAAVDAALDACEQSMRNLEIKGRTDLPAYAAMKAKRESLRMRRQQLGE